MHDVIVIGAGLAGLTAGHRLQQLGADVRVVDRGARAGGAVGTHRREGWRYEAGPNSFLGSASAMFDLAAELGVEAVPAKAAANKRYLFVDGALQALPTNPLEAVTTGVLPFATKLRLLGAPFAGSAPRDDESVREFFDARLGREATDRLVDAFVSGIYGGDIAHLGVAAAFPKLFGMVKEHGSLAKAAVAMARAKKKDPGEKPRRRGTFSFPGGLGDLVDAMTRRLGDRLDLGADLLVRRENGHWVVGPHRAPQLVVAAPAYAASTLLAREAPGLADELTEIEYAAMAGVHVLFDRAAVKKELDGFGFLIPRREGVRMLGCLWSSACFDTCAPDRVALTCFIGGAHDPGAVKLTEAELVEEISRDLRRTMGIDARPLDAAVVRLPKAIPQYGVRHLAWRERVRRLLNEQKGLALTGNYLEGVSMNDTIAHGDRTAREVAERLGAKRAA